MIGEYTLAKVVTIVRDDGTVVNPLFFARVLIEAESSLEKTRVIDAIQQVNRDLAEVNSKTHSDWMDAAIEGAKEILRSLEKLLGSKEYLVKVIRVVGTEVDTTEDAVKVAAAIATWRAINSSNSEPIPKFDGRCWTVEFPLP